jgi:hypothetical protein
MQTQGLMMDGGLMMGGGSLMAMAVTSQGRTSIPSYKSIQTSGIRGSEMAMRCAAHIYFM